MRRIHMFRVVSLLLVVFTLGFFFFNKQPSTPITVRGEVILNDEHLKEAVPSAMFYEAVGLTTGGVGQEAAILWIKENWSDQLLPYFIEIRRFIGVTSAVHNLSKIFEEQTEVDWADDAAMNQYVWKQDIENTIDYAAFKRSIHAEIDPRFAAYFEPSRQFDIRLDEITWGGVVQDGIPPLRSPKMISAKNATYLDDSDVVFGLEVNGDVRAYPRRILAWHEMFVDEVGGVSLAGVYCTLCGTVIAYDTEFEETQHALGTSGFLYRSNKLMYDQATQSMWSTLEGVPVVGPLVGEGIRLNQYGLVTTTWGEWKSRHPDTQVLSLDTGHRRNYNEGAAYRSYFATDARMFETPYRDDRLHNKDEVLALRFAQDTEKPVVIYEGYLRENPIYHNEIEGQPYLILTDSTGANRVYERPSDLRFVEWNKHSKVVDNLGRVWELSESALTDPDGNVLKRLAAHRAFWFGWHGAFPDTILIK